VELSQNYYGIKIVLIQLELLFTPRDYDAAVNVTIKRLSGFGSCPSRLGKVPAIAQNHAAFVNYRDRNER
jgi:hypothetical protein